MGRIMGLDYGSKTVGVALSDALKVIVSPYETIFREKEGKLRPTLRRLLEICQDEDVERIVLGLPLNMDGTEGERAERTRSFMELLRHRLDENGMDIDIMLWDERLSTEEALEVLRRSDIAPCEQKSFVDKVAAAIILEDFMRNGEK
ncbi:MAG TPA: Holliday junction resolvase RuvX [Candidatus Avilachnospira avistercoris]|nr:Holliday junction resolvase RuvX [Candidatus Avilachnospira avistercoris]